SRPSRSKATPMAHRTRTTLLTPRNSLANTSTGRLPAALVTTCRRRRHRLLPKRSSISLQVKLGEDFLDRLDARSLGAARQEILNRRMRFPAHARLYRGA